MKPFFALLLYRIAFICLLPIALLLLVIRSKKNPDYRKRLTERLGFLPMNFRSGGIVIHAASVGEVIAIKPLVEKILIAYPTIPITLTTFTPTGSAQVKVAFADRVQHCYLPIDNYLSNALFFRKLKPCAMVFMETELWPSLIHQAKNRGYKLLLVNARLTDKSVTQYQKLTPLIQPALACFNKILCQSEINQQRFTSIGAEVENCTVSGNLKYDIADNSAIDGKQKELAELISVKTKVWLVASTHPGDETIVLQAFKQVLASFPETLLIIVPRHPERFVSIYQQSIAAQFKTIKRSTKQKLTPDDNVWLLDTLGELMSVFALADIVTMGGSFSEVGGHNPLEPALFKKPIITGANMSNFTEVMEKLCQEAAIIQLKETDDAINTLASKVMQLLADPAQRELLGKKAQQVVINNQGATERTLKVLKNLIDNKR